ncbi:hypothetical protein L218DRAFT_185452 [Marasmius fiardii PR-910]|nr:hypothetical protein L218DRAFT_185452 [Marasmius fiardii PR-910]
MAHSNTPPTSKASSFTTLATTQLPGIRLPPNSLTYVAGDSPTTITEISPATIITTALSTLVSEQTVTETTSATIVSSALSTLISGGTTVITEYESTQSVMLTVTVDVLATKTETRYMFHFNHGSPGRHHKSELSRSLAH